MTNTAETPAERILRVASARRNRALAMRQAGLTYPAIGMELGCSAERAGQIVQRALADNKRDNPEPAP